MHSEQVCEVFSRCFTRTPRVLLSRLGLNSIYFELITELLRLTVKLHDIGKIQQEYQKSLKVRGFCPYGPTGNCSKCDLRPNFSRHEEISAQVVYNITSSILFELEPEKEDLRTSLSHILAYGVLYHHEAIHRPLEWSKKSPFIKEVIKSNYDFVMKIIGPSCRALGVDANKILEDLIERPAPFNKPVQAMRSALKLHSLVSGPLMICDNVVASLHRPPKKEGKERPTFVREAEKAIPELQNWINNHKCPYDF